MPITKNDFQVALDRAACVPVAQALKTLRETRLRVHTSLGVQRTRKCGRSPREDLTDWIFSFYMQSTTKECCWKDTFVK